METCGCVLIWQSKVIGRNQIEHDERLRAVLDRLQEEGITLNYEKCVFSVSRLEYLGQIIDGQGIRKDPSKVQAIVDFPELRDVAELRKFLGMVNQLMKFCPNLAEHTNALRDLLRTNTVWLWGPHQVDASTCLKKEFASERILSIYHPEYETIVSTNASSYGLGAVLRQKQPTCKLKPVAYPVGPWQIPNADMCKPKKKYWHCIIWALDSGTLARLPDRATKG